MLTGTVLHTIGPLHLNENLR